MMENDNINNLKSEIIKLTKKYGEIKEKKEFIPGKSWILYSGRFFGSEKYESMGLRPLWMGGLLRENTLKCLKMLYLSILEFTILPL